MMTRKRPKETPETDPYQTGFYFFWKWQYYLRHQYLDLIDGIDPVDWPNVDDFLLSQEKNQRYIRTSSQILGAYLEGKLKLKHLPTMAPLWFRSGHGIAEYEIKDGQLCINLNTRGLDIPRFRQAIKDELDGVLNMIIDSQQKGEEGGRMPEKITPLYLPLYWRNASTGGVENLNVDMMIRTTGLWLWDRWILSLKREYKKTHC